MQGCYYRLFAASWKIGIVGRKAANDEIEVCALLRANSVWIIKFQRRLLVIFFRTRLLTCIDRQLSAIHYGNPGAESSNLGRAVFIFFPLIFGVFACLDFTL